MESLARAALALTLSGLLVAPAQVRADEPAPDALEQRLDATGLSEAALAETSEALPPEEDVEITVISDPPELRLRATPLLESGDGTERPVCRAPCTTLVARGAYRFVLETRRGRDRAVPGAYSLFRDGQLELSIESRRGRRIAWWTATAALVGSGLAMFFTQRQPLDNNDPACTSNCYRYSPRQTALMTVGGIVVIFGGITAKSAIATRDIGHVTYRPRRSHPTEP